MFSCEFCKISKNTFFTEHVWATASITYQKPLTKHSCNIFPSKTHLFPSKTHKCTIEYWLLASYSSYKLLSGLLEFNREPLRQLPIKTLSKSLLLITVPLITNNVLLIIIYSGDVHKCSTCPKLKGTLMQIWKFQCRLGFV